MYQFKMKKEVIDYIKTMKLTFHKQTDYKYHIQPSNKYFKQMLHLNEKVNENGTRTQVYSGRHSSSAG